MREKLLHTRARSRSVRRVVPYTASAAIYDALYGKWDYAREARLLRRLISSHCHGSAATLLDVACGTGKHLARLRRHLRVRGLDASPAMLRVARERLPGVPLHRGSYLDFDLGRTFDVVLCMGSAIGYSRDRRGLRTAMRMMARHLGPGGAAFVVPWVLRSDWIPGRNQTETATRGAASIARMSVSRGRGRLSAVEMHHLVGSRAGIDHFVERHALGLFSVGEYLGAMRAAGLKAKWLPKGRDWFRGLLIGVRPLSASSSRPAARAGRPSRLARGRRAAGR